MTPEFDQGSVPPVDSPPTLGEEGASDRLQRRYLAYRERQGRDLLALLPREGLRELIRTLRSESSGELDFESPGALDRLAARCQALLPLPPFEVWRRDFHLNRSAHVGQEPASLAPEGVEEGPVTVDVRDLRADDGSEWVASLELRAADGRWAGSVRFHTGTDATVHRTGPILREADPLSVRERFRGFDASTLRALLRSALP